MNIDNSLEELPFELLMERLEGVAESLASDSDGLEQAMKKYEMGLAFAKECLKRLDQAEQHVIQLKSSLSSDNTLGMPR